MQEDNTNLQKEQQTSEMVNTWEICNYICVSYVLNYMSYALSKKITVERKFYHTVLLGLQYVQMHYIYIAIILKGDMALFLCKVSIIYQK